MHLYSGDILAATGGGCSSLSPRSFHWASNKRHILAFIGLDHHHHHHHLLNHHQLYHNPFVASQSELNSFTHRLIYHHHLHSLECPRYVADQQMSDDDLPRNTNCFAASRRSLRLGPPVWESDLCHCVTVMIFRKIKKKKIKTFLSETYTCLC